MKKLFIITALFMSAISYQTAKAQVSFHLSLNIGSQPDWGPVGYDHVDYYYMPDIDTYYYVPTHQYVYYENNVWVHRTYLPARYRGYKVVINRPSPWLRNSYYHNTYAKYRGRHDQVIIRDSHDAKYVNHWHAPAHRAPVHHAPEHHDNGHHDNGHHGNDHHDNGHHGGGDHGHGHGKH